MNKRYWTAEQDALILANTLDDDSLAQVLGRSPEAIRLRRWKVRTGRATPDFQTGRPANRPEDVWRYVEIGEPDECWPWIAATRRNGYGTFSIDNVDCIAHRVAFQVATGVDPGDRFVCHHCDNPPCCNPAHLFLGTHTDNMRDMVAKGRDRWRRATA